MKYLLAIEKYNPSLLSRLDRFRSNDDHGGANVFEYGPHGKFSPSTLRYVRHLGHLSEVFGSLDGLSIVEVGGGYGGLCKIILDHWDVSSYTIIDLPDVLSLAKQWLCASTSANAFAKVRFLSDVESQTNSWNLFISNCAFTECLPNVQEIYLRHIIGKSENGFLIYNRTKESLPVPELLGKIALRVPKPLGTIPEDPLTHRSNFVLVWGPRVQLSTLRPLPFRFSRAIHRVSPRSTKPCAKASCELSSSA
jgi:O-methyltransferase